MPRTLTYHSAKLSELLRDQENEKRRKAEKQLLPIAVFIRIEYNIRNA